MDYIGILKRAASITWNNKVLWLFGFLVVLFEGGGGSGNNGGGMSGYRWPGESTGGRGMGQMPNWNWPNVEFSPGLVAAMVVAGLLLVVLVVMLNMVSNAALMGLVRDVDGGQRAGVRRGFSLGFRRFLSYFGVNFVVSVPAGLLTIGLVLLGCAPLLLLLARSMPATAAGVALTVILMIPIGLFLLALWTALTILLEFFLRACVLERQGVSGSLSRGWDAFSSNVGRSLAMALLLFGCGILLALLMIPLGIGLIGGTVMAAVLAWGFTHSIGWTVGVGLALGIPSILFLSFLGGIYKSFTSGAWTLAYLRMAGLEQVPVASPAVVPVPAEGPAPETTPAVTMRGSAGLDPAGDTDVVVDGVAQ